MPGGRARWGRKRSPHESAYLSHWKYVCKRDTCNVEGYGPKGDPCWLCGEKDMMTEAIAIVEKSNGASWNNPHTMQFATEEPDAAS